MFLIGYNFSGFSTGAMPGDNTNRFEKNMVRVRESFAQIVFFTTLSKLSSTEGRVLAQERAKKF